VRPRGGGGGRGGGGVTRLLHVFIGNKDISFRAVFSPECVFLYSVLFHGY